MSPLLRYLWRRLRGWTDWPLGVLLPEILGLARFFRGHRQLRHQWPGPPVPLGPQVALFVHFDRHGALAEHVWRYLAALGDAGWSVVLVSNAATLRPDALARAQDVCAAILVRRNIGYDFGAWREALETLGLPRADTTRIALINDSVYGPLAPLGPILREMDPDHADAWGLTDSWQRRYHLQSYFLVVGRKVLDSAAWRGFWRGVRPSPSKQFVIRHYEIGLTQALLRAGFTCRAVFPYRMLLGRMAEAADAPRNAAPQARARLRQMRAVQEAMSAREPLNPTSDLWRPLLETGYPFIKRELLRDNPGRVADLAEWREVVQRTMQADLSAIERDLERTLRNRAP